MKSNANADSNANTKEASALNIQYHGGSVMLGTINVYPVFYGKWSETQKEIIRSFIRGIGDTRWFDIMKKYYQITDTIKTFVTGPVVLSTEIDVGYMFGKRIKGTNIEDGLKDLFNNGKLDKDPNGIYLWFTSEDVSEIDNWGRRFIQEHCGWHFFFEIGTEKYQYGFVGNPARFPHSGCLSFKGDQAISPNNDPGVDSMIPYIAHELAETISNPYSDAWYEPEGYENADRW
ncbi:unnamed protein product [Rotaria sp. Silwood1]|nr:unnamed protein product [Rotaria sp. Silwood1]